MLPDPHVYLGSLLREHVGLPVAKRIWLQFGLPVVDIRFWVGRVLRAPVPPASINKVVCLGRREHQVRRASGRRGRPRRHSVTESASVQVASKRKLGTSGAGAVGQHQAPDRLRSGPRPIRQRLSHGTDWQHCQRNLIVSRRCGSRESASVERPHPKPLARAMSHNCGSQRHSLGPQKASVLGRGAGERSGQEPILGIVHRVRCLNSLPATP